VDQITALAADIATPSQPPTATEPCPLWAEVKTLWDELIKIHHKEAVVILLRFLATEA